MASGALTSAVGLAAEPPSDRAPHENHPATTHPAALIHPGKPHLEQNKPKSGQPGPLHTQTKPAAGKELLQRDAKRAAASTHSGVTMNKLETHHETHEAPAKLAENKSKIAPEPTLNHGRSASSPVMHGLTIPGAKYSTAALNGSDFKRKP
jgi:hypothetical protein